VLVIGDEISFPMMVYSVEYREYTDMETCVSMAESVCCTMVKSPYLYIHDIPRYIPSLGTRSRHQ
jgi:hypothetical protein